MVRPLELGPGVLPHTPGPLLTRRPARVASGELSPAPTVPVGGGTTNTSSEKILVRDQEGELLGLGDLWRTSEAVTATYWAGTARLLERRAL